MSSKDFPVAGICLLPIITAEFGTFGKPMCGLRMSALEVEANVLREPTYFRH
jgi:hypothetical protein